MPELAGCAVEAGGGAAVRDRKRTGRADVQTESAPGAPLQSIEQLRLRYARLRAVTPRTGERTAFQEYRSPYPRPFVRGEAVHVEHETLGRTDGRVES